LPVAVDNPGAAIDNRPSTYTMEVADGLKSRLDSDLPNEAPNPIDTNSR
jgi:hypothetical protein